MWQSEPKHVLFTTSFTLAKVANVEVPLAPPQEATPVPPLPVTAPGSIDPAQPATAENNVTTATARERSDTQNFIHLDSRRSGTTRIDLTLSRPLRLELRVLAGLFDHRG